ncbi:MAG: hypothetical protein HYR63_17795 [Proteobacteria bacterium]|nr:hypothetical protein [Pseudomonadota bacterium]MBI3496160.1 hypothetical protein [Pseudomonadota bacterium]
MSALTKPIDTAKLSETLRARAIDVAGRRLLVSRLAGSEQEVDLSAPTNCRGYGRVRHFKQTTSSGWPINPLPIVPASKALGINPPPQMMRAQVFQNAACAWRCWYCFVPYNLLSANQSLSAWLTPEELVSMYQAEPDRPRIIDLSGGSPDLIPEWTPWMMSALKNVGLDQTTYLWTDDNLSTTYLFDKLDQTQLDIMQEYKNYGRVCCFKGYDARSFAFNTRAAEEDFDNQFVIMRRLLTLDIDLYGYVTLTSPYSEGVAASVANFVDRLQNLNPNLPLRVTPLQIRVFSPVNSRLTADRERSLAVQEEAIAAWESELDRRFEPTARALDVANVPITGVQ